MPASTSAGVLGMTRTTGVPPGSAASIRAVGIPAATDTTRWRPGSTEAARAFSSVPYGVRWNGIRRSSRDAVAHLLAIWPVAVFGGYVARHFHVRSEGFDPQGRMAGSE